MSSVLSGHLHWFFMKFGMKGPSGTKAKPRGICKDQFFISFIPTTTDVYFKQCRLQHIVRVLKSYTSKTCGHTKRQP